MHFDSAHWPALLVGNILCTSSRPFYGPVATEARKDFAAVKRAVLPCRAFRFRLLCRPSHTGRTERKGLFMAAFKQHLMFSCALGAGYTVALRYANFEPTHALLAGGLCGVSGMLPDLDSDSGRPVRELFGLMAAVVPLLVLHRLKKAGFTPEGMILLMAALY